MKIRMGFVSNSSSSSFCIVGYSIDSDKFDDYDDLYEIFKPSKLVCSRGISDYSDSYIIGKYIENMKDDETLLDFKKGILKEIQDYYDTNVSLKDIEIFVDGGYDA